MGFIARACCFFGIWEAGRMARSICGCLCCFIIGGPILFIVGLVLLFGHNSRSGDVSSYNTAIAQYNTTVLNLNGMVPANVTTTSGTSQLTQITQMVPITGNRDGVDPATSYLLTTSVGYNTGAINVYLPDSVGFSRTYSATKTASTTMQCNYNGGCYASEMRNKCSSQYNGNCRNCGCSSSGSCGVCDYSVYATDVCSVVTAPNASMAAGPYTPSSQYTSCYYPFGASDNKYSTSVPSRTSFTVRSANDPFIAAQRITKGDMDFGATAGQQRRVGLILVGLGSFFLACVVCLACVLYRCVRGATESAYQNEAFMDGQQAQYGGAPMVPPPVPVQQVHYHQHNHYAPQGAPSPQYQQQQGYPPQQGYPQQYQQGYPIQQQQPVYGQY